MIISRDRFDRYFDIFFLVLMVILLVGTPLIFSSLTRSVFEVNKLLLLRLVTLVTIGGYSVKVMILKSNRLKVREEKEVVSFSISRFKMPFSVTIFLWVLSTTLSTFFSQNIPLSIIGAYDRWEGIVTVINYVILYLMFAFLLRRRFQMHILTGVLIIGAGLSSLYGVCQSLGYDFMVWSVNPTQRVFACINNPVHFCAYLAMILPMGISWLMWLSSKSKTLSQNTFRSIYLMCLYAFSALPLAFVFLSYIRDFSLFQKILFYTFLITFLTLLYGLLIFFRNRYGHIFFRISYVSIITIFVSLLAILTTLTYAPDAIGPIGIAVTCFIGFAEFCAIQPPNVRYINLLNGGRLCASILATLVFSVSYPPVSMLWMLAFVSVGWAITLKDRQTVPNLISALMWLGYFLVSIPLMYVISFPKEGIIAVLFLLMANYVLAPLPDWRVGLKRGLLMILVIIYYTQYLSFSRATWIAFVGSMTLFYAISFNLFRQEKSSVFIRDVLLLGLFTGATYLSTIFGLHVVPSVAIGLGLLIILYTAYSFYTIGSFSTFEYVRVGAALVITLTAFGSDLSAFLPDLIVFLIITSAAISLLWLSRRSTSSEAKLLSRFVIVLIFSKLQFVFYEKTTALSFFILVALFFLLSTRFNHDLNKEQRTWLISFLVVFALVIIAPIIPGYLQHVFPKNDQTIRVLNATSRVSLYAQDAKEGTARTSMWRSSLPWIGDYPVIGSGLDTIKYMYPDYREPEYGILEGGHNYTPDRLHNEYLNTLATKGLFGFVAYYGLIIFTWILLLLKGIVDFKSNPYRFMTLGFLCGGLIYLGQILFNFGVVATLVLFYVMMGMGLSLVVNREFHDIDSEGGRHA